MATGNSPLNPRNFYKLRADQRTIINNGPGWYYWYLGRWIPVPSGQQNDQSATPPMRGARWFTKRQLDLMGVKVQ